MEHLPPFDPELFFQLDRLEHFLGTLVGQWLAWLGKAPWNGLLSPKLLQRPEPGKVSKQDPLLSPAIPVLSAHRLNFGRNTWGSPPKSHRSDLASPEWPAAIFLLAPIVDYPWLYRLPATEQRGFLSWVGRLRYLTSELVPTIPGSDGPRQFLLLVWLPGSHEYIPCQLAQDSPSSLLLNCLGSF